MSLSIYNWEETGEFKRRDEKDLNKTPLNTEAKPSVFNGLRSIHVWPSLSVKSTLGGLFQMLHYILKSFSSPLKKLHFFPSE